MPDKFSEHGKKVNSTGCSPELMPYLFEDQMLFCLKVAHTVSVQEVA